MTALLIAVGIGVVFAAFGAWVERDEVDTLDAEYWRSI
jgi:hypothetical protein